MRERILFDRDWYFHCGDVNIDYPQIKGPVYTMAKTERIKMGPASRYYDIDVEGYNCTCEIKGEKWEVVDLPHDYVISQTPSAENNETLGYFNYQNAWYRKDFECTSEDLQKRIILYFEGVATHATVYLNGSIICRNFCGYTPFTADISDYVCEGKNVLAVYVDATTSHEGWWYEGAGIYRHVWLIKTDKIAIDTWGVYVHPEKKDANTWSVPVETTVLNDTKALAEVKINHIIKDSNGATVCRFSSFAEIPAYNKTQALTEGIISSPSLWSPDTPVLYTLETEICLGDAVIDTVETRFGFRTIECTPNDGLLINGVRTPINGVCAHQDFGVTGKALPDNVHRYKAQLIKEMGANGYRTSHYPHSEALMDAMDELGFIVMNETRWFESSDEGIKQLEALVKRDRNRPSVFLWSIGNEEIITTTPQGKKIADRMVSAVKKLDNTRPVTMAISHASEGVTMYDSLDVIGLNYSLSEFDRLHEEYPDKPIFSSECCATGTTRGWYFPDSPEKGYTSAYDKDTSNWFRGRENTTAFFETRPWVMGVYQWIAFEHRGESVKWPRLCSMSGAIDLYLQKKDAFYQNQSFWIKDRPVLHILPHWNFEGMEGEIIDVWAYTNCSEVELFVNGNSFGRVEVKPNRHAEWKVPYAPGEIKAIGYMDGKEVATDIRTTTGKAVSLGLKLENIVKANGMDIAVISCYAMDEEGREVPTASPVVSFNCNSLGTIVGTGSANTDVIPVTSSERKMWNGRITVAVKVKDLEGTLKVYAQSAYLKTAVLNIELKN